MVYSSSTDRERQPLVGSAPSGYNALDDSSTGPPDGLPLPEVAPQGKTLTWSSAYILVVSRVIGSGVFATPGSIVKSAGSVGLSLSLWLAGTVLAACGMVVFMEYGCMLPRSGGEKVTTLLRVCLLYIVDSSVFRCVWNTPTLDPDSSRPRSSQCKLSC